MIDFEKMLRRAQMRDKSAIEFLLNLYRPLLIRLSKVNGRLDEDLYQELCITLLRCIRLFRIP